MVILLLQERKSIKNYHGVTQNAGELVNQMMVPKKATSQNNKAYFSLRNKRYASSCLLSSLEFSGQVEYKFSITLTYVIMTALVLREMRHFIKKFLEHNKYRNRGDFISPFRSGME